MQCNTVSLALDVLYGRGFCWRPPFFLLVWVVLCFSACSFSELNTAWPVQRSSAEKPIQGSQEQRGRGSRKRHYHLFEIKEGRICGTSLSSEKEDLALVDLRCVTANAAQTVMGKILPSLLQGRGRLTPGSVKLNIFPLEWGGNGERGRHFTAAGLIYGLTIKNQHCQHLLLYLLTAVEANYPNNHL